MPKRKTTTLSLAIVCFTLLAALALIRDDLCKVEYRSVTVPCYLTLFLPTK